MATTTDYAALGRWLKRRRRSLNLTQDALAERVGCAPSMLQKIEQGTRRPSRDLAERLVDALGVPPHERAQVLGLAHAGIPEPADQPDAGAIAPGLGEPATAREPALPLLL